MSYPDYSYEAYPATQPGTGTGITDKIQNLFKNHTVVIIAAAVVLVIVFALTKSSKNKKTALLF